MRMALRATSNEALIVGAEVEAPVADAVRFVNHDKAYPGE